MVANGTGQKEETGHDGHGNEDANGKSVPNETSRKPIGNVHDDFIDFMVDGSNHDG